MLTEKYEEQNNLCEKITNYIKKGGYTWTFEKILKEYLKSKDGYYISNTANEIVNKFKKEMDLLTLR